MDLGKRDLLGSIFVAVVTFFFLSNQMLFMVNDPLMRDGSMLTGTRYTITKDALITIAEDDSQSVIGMGSSQMFKALDGNCISNELTNNVSVYNIAQPSSRPYTDMLHIPRIVDADPDIVLIEVAPNILINTSKSSEEYVELRFKLDTMNQDSTDIGGWVDIIDPDHMEWLALNNLERMKFKQDYFLAATEERLTRLLLDESSARDVDAYGYIPDSDSELWVDYLKTPTFPADRYGFDGKSPEQREEYNNTQMEKTANYKPAFSDSQSHAALDYEISTLLKNEINVILVGPPHHPLALSHVPQNKWGGMNHTLQKYSNWPGVTIVDFTWSDGWIDDHFYDRNHLDDEGRQEFCERLAPYIDSALESANARINFDEYSDETSEKNIPPITTSNRHSPQFMVLSVNVEAGSKCADSTILGDNKNQVLRCVWGEFGEERAGISEMMDAADSVGVKISFFIDVLGYFSYGVDVVEVMQYIDSRGHDVQMRMYPSMVNSSSWNTILQTPEWIDSGAEKESYMSCWSQETSDFWFKKSIEIFDLAEVKRPIAFRAGAFRYCDTIIQSMGNHNLTQSYNYNLYSSNQNFSFGYVQNFEWDNGVFELPVSYIVSQDGTLSSYSRMDESAYEQEWNIEETLDRFYAETPSTRVLTMTMYSFSLLSKNESNHFYYADDNKLLQFESFLQNFPDEIDIISATELQEYIDSGEIKSELVLPISSLQNECHK
ncbi:hypothetical protein N9V30_01545 [Candidatus Poseidoniales archaeon]|nr:hypothetical protein [Candidatus Poseidoniales archaeon]